MLNLRSTPDEIIREAFSKADTQYGTDMPAGVRGLLSSVSGYDDLVSKLQTGADLDSDSAHTVATSTIYGALEKAGINPNEWKLTVTPIELGKVRYGPEEYEEARRFLGSWTKIAEIALLVATLASLFIGGWAVFLAGTTARAIFIALRAGQSLSRIKLLLDIAKLKGIKWLTIPSLTAGLATLTSWFAQTQITATGDLTTYIKQGVARSQAIVDAVEEGGAGAVPRLGASILTGAPRDTGIQRTSTQTTKKPKIFLGSILTGTVGDEQPFTRKVDDKITDEKDLMNDVVINLVSWIKSLPGLITYEVQIKFNPFDNRGQIRLGTWAVLSLYMSNNIGKRMFIDEVLLGPIDPKVYYPDTVTTERIQFDIATVLGVGTVVKPTVSGLGISVPTKDGETITVLEATPTPDTTAISTSLQAAQKTVEKLQAQVTALSQQAPPVVQQTPQVVPAPAGAVSGIPPPPPPLPPPAPVVAPPPPPPRGKFIPQLGLFVGEIYQVDTGSAQNLNARGAGGLSAPIIASLPNGTRVKIAGEYGQQDGYYWLNVKRLDRDESLYVAGEFLAAI